MNSADLLPASVLTLGAPGAVIHTCAQWRGRRRFPGDHRHAGARLRRLLGSPTGAAAFAELYVGKNTDT
ncbi:hypothetical protein ACFVYR_00810 [Streptomyces sp. NPDC058284]|uniref:hypothetical protein n=1 Tax=unclassified Streptomyces TaxID=2593676 RepID=UPI00364DF8DA